MIVATYAAAALRPIRDATVVTDIAFMAGPTIRNTNAAPGETPFNMRDAAIGMDAVEHTYIGKPIIAIAGIASQSLPPNASAKKPSGTRTVTSADTARPTASGLTTEPRSRLYACHSTMTINQLKDRKLAISIKVDELKDIGKVIEKMDSFAWSEKIYENEYSKIADILVNNTKQEI